VKQRIDLRIQPKLDDRLRHAVRYRRHAQHTNASCLLRNRNGFDWRRKIAAGAHPVPKLVQIVTQAFFELFNRLLIDARSTAIVLHILKCLPYESFGNVKWLGCHARLLPLTRLALLSPRMTPPLCSAAITAASTLLRAAPSLDGALLLSALPFGLVPFASHRRRRFPQFNIRARSRLALPLCRTPSGP
jgi:hypothetical protein